MRAARLAVGEAAAAATTGGVCAPVRARRRWAVQCVLAALAVRCAAAEVRLRRVLYLGSGPGDRRRRRRLCGEGKKG